jgi:hypothetical protein
MSRALTWGWRDERMPGKKIPSLLYATTQIVSTTLTVLILHNDESVYFVYSNSAYKAQRNTYTHTHTHIFPYLFSYALIYSKNWIISGNCFSLKFLTFGEEECQLCYRHCDCRRKFSNMSTPSFLSQLTTGYFDTSSPNVYRLTTSNVPVYLNDFSNLNWISRNTN